MEKVQPQMVKSQNLVHYKYSTNPSIFLHMHTLASRDCGETSIVALEWILSLLFYSLTNHHWLCVVKLVKGKANT